MLIKMGPPPLLQVDPSLVVAAAKLYMWGSPVLSLLRYAASTSPYNTWVVPDVACGCSYLKGSGLPSLGYLPSHSLMDLTMGKGADGGMRQ